VNPSRCITKTFGVNVPGHFPDILFPVLDISFFTKLLWYKEGITVPYQTIAGFFSAADVLESVINAAYLINKEKKKSPPG